MKKLPLLLSQERMWFEWKLNSNSLAYNTVFLFRLKSKIENRADIPSSGLSGKCDPTFLKRSLDLLIRRHESLRTSYIEENNIPYQLLHDHWRDDWNDYFQNYDISSIPGHEKEIVSNQLIDQHFFIPFDLEKAPPHRYIYIQLTQDTSILGFSWHHIMIDAASVEIFLKEFAYVYNSLVANREVYFNQDPSSIQEWINLEKKQDNKEGILYWKKLLERTDFFVLLPKTKQKGRDQRIRYKLDHDLTQALVQLVSKTESSLFVVLTSALQALLYCYTRQKEFTIGYSVNSRKKIHRNAIGFFVNNLPMVVQIDESTTFLDLVTQMMSRRQYEAVSLNEIIHEIRKERDTPYHSLFNIQVNQSSYLSFRLNLDGIQSDPIPIINIDSENELTMKYDHFEHIELEFDYRVSCFSHAFIENLIKNYEQLLKWIIKYPHLKIHQELNLLNAFEKNKILKEWNETEEYFDSPDTLHELFEEQVRKTPHNLAVIKDDNSVTYQQLNSHANLFAQYLQSIGVSKETLVAVHLHPSIEMLVAILGILKAGGAYVPVDPDLPEERIQFIFKDIRTDIVITQETVISIIYGCLYSDKNLYSTISNPQDLAYVIYTSGSTGTPKGVMIEHQACVNYINWCKKTYPTDGGKEIPLVSSFAFDMSVTSLFLPLATGKTIVLNEHSLIHPFSNKCLVKMTPSHIKILSHAHNCMSPVTFVIGGEDFKWDDVDLLKKMYPLATIYNEYGPTEATVACSAFKIDLHEEEGSVSIGKPISNTEIYVLDEFLNPVAVGCVGELYIGGKGLARGYLNQPILTEERFIQNPMKDTLSPRLYKTGDLARFRLDGNIEFLGREDTQVKVKGFRIELKEIEATLKKHGDIKDALVIQNKKSQLITYFIPDEFVPTSAELIHFLKERLPYYMIPEFFIHLKNFPLTANGKLDYRALPQPNFPLEENKLDNQLETEIEKTIGKIWSKLLQKADIKKHDDFFKIGGHSLLATQCASQLRSCFNVEISLKMLFLHPTLASLADYINNQPKNVLTSILKRKR